MYTIMKPFCFWSSYRWSFGSALGDGEINRGRGKGESLKLRTAPSRMADTAWGIVFWLRGGNISWLWVLCPPCWFSLVNGTSMNSSQIFCGMYPQFPGRSWTETDNWTGQVQNGSWSPSLASSVSASDNCMIMVTKQKPSPQIIKGP